MKKKKYIKITCSDCSAIGFRPLRQKVTRSERLKLAGGTMMAFGTPVYNNARAVRTTALAVQPLNQCRSCGSPRVQKELIKH